MRTWHIQVYKFDKADIEGLRNHMEEFYKSFISEADKLTLEENWRSFESTIIKATDTFIPSSYKSSRFNLPWVNRPLKRIIRRKHRAFYKAKSLDTHRSWEHYRSLRKAVQKELRKAEHHHLSTNYKCF